MVRALSNSLPGENRMLRSYRLENGDLKGVTVAGENALSGDALWLDLLDPTEDERDAVSRRVGARLPSRADMEEIEISSRLFQEGTSVYMTALVLANSETDHPVTDAVTFVLLHDRLVTIRYVDPHAFRMFASRCDRGAVHVQTPEAIMLALLDSVIDRVADILERAGADVEKISREIFDPEARLDTRAYQAVLGRLGRKNDLTGKLRESLLTIARLLSFLTQHVEERADKETRARIGSLGRDIHSLQDHSSYLAGKLNYLLEATLGLINIDQNNIIKMMSIAATIFLPPTLIASIANFKYLPELGWPWGYPVSLIVMLVSAIVPYLWFRRRGWL
jgi:magnesium transporter